MAEEIVGEIQKLKQERGAVILAHNYQHPDVQDLADFVGDSLELSRQAAQTDAKVIVFCGVHFMAETAAILSPQKTVLLPDIHAGCPMADMITAKQLRQKKKELPGVPVVCYINSSAEVKSESDICCTSANSVAVVESLNVPEVIFVPDQYLGMYTASQTKIKFFLWPGFCPTHMKILPEHITELRKVYPRARALVHPECRPEVIRVADEVLSTGGMLRYIKMTGTCEYIIGTETGILHRMRKEFPHSTFIPANDKAVCPNMKLTTPEKVLAALRDMKPVVTVPEDIHEKAKVTVDRMLAIR